MDGADKVTVSLVPTFTFSAHWSEVGGRVTVLPPLWMERGWPGWRWVASRVSTPVAASFSFTKLTTLPMVRGKVIPLRSIATLYVVPNRLTAIENFTSPWKAGTSVLVELVSGGVKYSVLAFGTPSVALAEVATSPWAMRSFSNSALFT